MTFDASRENGRAPFLSTQEILGRSALEQAALIAKGAISSEELTQMYLDAIDRKNPVVSAFVDVIHAQAIREANAFDKLRRKGRDRLPPFAGVPIGIKDLNLAKGSFSRFGSRAFERFFSPFDDETTAQLRRGGFVIVGKTSTSELGSLPVTEPAIHPPTRNPWDLGVTPGGSSGGAGAAVAAHMIPIAQGSDAAGSIRIPASFCNLYGIKPSRGRVANAYGQDDGDILYTSGPIARTVDDAAAMLDVMAGITVGKPHWAPPPARPFLELAHRPPRALRIRMTTSISLTTTHPDVVAATKRIARLLEDLGHHVEEAPGFVGSVEEFLPIWQHTAAEAPVHDWALTEPVTRWLGEKGRGLKRDDIARLMARMSRDVLAWFGDADLWLSPTVACPPPKIGAWRGLEPDEVFERASHLGMFTAPFNVSGQPAASVPAGMSKAGFPIGAQIVGRPMEDGIVLAVSRQIEEAMPWGGNVAPEIDA